MWIVFKINLEFLIRSILIYFVDYNNDLFNKSIEF
jgi:hypothetical protein